MPPQIVRAKGPYYAPKDISTRTTGQTQSPFDRLLATFEKQAETARAANIKRYEQAMAIYDEIVQRYGPGGTFMAGALEQLEREKIRDVGAGAQRLISGGLFGTERAGGLERGWEAEVGAPARLKLEDIRMERLSQAQLGKAGLIERREDIYPSAATLASLAQAFGQGAGGGGGFIGGYGGGQPMTTPTSPSIPTAKPTDTGLLKGTGALPGPGWTPKMAPGYLTYAGYGDAGAGAGKMSFEKWKLAAYKPLIPAKFHAHIPSWEGAGLRAQYKQYLSTGKMPKLTPQQRAAYKQL